MSQLEFVDFYTADGSLYRNQRFLLLSALLVYPFSALFLMDFPMVHQLEMTVAEVEAELRQTVKIPASIGKSLAHRKTVLE